MVCELFQGEGGEIEWGEGGDIQIAVVDDSAGHIAMETAGEEGVARGTDALTVLDNAEIRNSFLNELMEVGTHTVNSLIFHAFYSANFTIEETYKLQN